MTTTTPTEAALRAIDGRIIYWAKLIAGPRTSDVPDLIQVGRIAALTQLRAGQERRQAVQRARQAMGRKARQSNPQPLPDYTLETLPPVEYPSTATVDLKIRIPPETRSALQRAIVLEARKRSINEIVNEAINEWISGARLTNGPNY